jgi:hypothetical protein
MTNGQILEIADQAGLKIDQRFGECYTGNVQLIAFARLIEKRVREEIAKKFDGEVWAYDYREIAAAIRKGGAE